MSFFTRNIIHFSFIFFLFLWSAVQAEQDTEHRLNTKRVIFIDSYYYPAYEWAAREVNGARSILESAEVEMKVISMDTKHNPDEDYIKAAALKAKAEIERYKPDLIIACDDNASKYLVQPE